MKKVFIISLSTLISTVLLGQAVQHPNDPHYNKVIPDKFIEVPAVILIVCLAVHVLLTIIRMFLDNRLKAKMIEKGVSEDLIKPFIQRNPLELVIEALKWVLLLAGLALGIFMASLFRIGIQSSGFIVVGLAIGMFFYYLLLKAKYKQ